MIFFYSVDLRLGMNVTKKKVLVFVGVDRTMCYIDIQSE